MDSKDPSTSEQGTAGKRKHVTFTPQKLEINGMEYSSDWLCGPHIRAFTKTLYLQVPSDNPAPVQSHGCRTKGILLYSKHCLTILHTYVDSES
jgi:hypothetical protein